uniref:SET domain containing protein n=2 Tax=Babesia bovis TaxID=5865 RepID=A7AVK3_BABBO|eukprot:XP_001609397.1 SET domain containing protein [Babesia bovis T2Bo]
MLFKGLARYATICSDSESSSEESSLIEGTVSADSRPSSSDVFHDTDNLDVCVDAIPLDSVYYNTIIKINRNDTSNLDDFERDIRKRDPTLHFAKSAQGLSGILRNGLSETPRPQQLIWLIARFEAICQRLHESGNSICSIVSGNASMTVKQLLQLFEKERKKIFGSVDFFPIGEPYLGIPPFSHFFKREELFYFGLCSMPYDEVSIHSIEGTIDAVQSLILDDSQCLRYDLGTRFVLYSHFENCGNDTVQYTDCSEALFHSWINETPIRIVRAFNAISRYAPLWGYRYDGLYRIIGMYSDNNKQGYRVWAYIFSVCNPELEPPVFVPSEEHFELGSITDQELKSYLSMQFELHMKSQRILRRRLPEDLRRVDVYLSGQHLFTIAVPHLLRHNSRTVGSSRLPLVVNFAIIYRYIKRLCEKTGLAKDWLSGPVAEYERGRREVSDVWWSRGGFLPMKLMMQYQEPRRLLRVDMGDGTYHKRVVSHSVRYQKSLAINREMAKTIARPFFPQSDTDSIWTYLDLAEPMPSSWNPYEDISAGSEIHPIPVINNVDDELPPMVFTYIRSNIYFSRLPQLNFDPVCAGCVPDGVKKGACQPVAINGFCMGLMDSNGRVYCQGINKSYLSTIQSRAACSDNCPCSDSCTNRLAEGVQLPVKLLKTSNMGWALHCMVPISAGTYIMQYIGEIICRREMMAREHQYDKLGKFNYCMEAVEMETLYDDWQMPCIDSMLVGNIARFLNHSCDPNVEVITVWRGDDFPCIAVYAIRDIPAGEALTYCYGSQYKSIPCLCGTDKCKGVIGNI